MFAILRVHLDCHRVRVCGVVACHGLRAPRRSHGGIAAMEFTALLLQVQLARVAGRLPRAPLAVAG